MIAVGVVGSVWFDEEHQIEALRRRLDELNPTIVITGTRGGAEAAARDYAALRNKTCVEFSHYLRDSEKTNQRALVRRNRLIVTELAKYEHRLLLRCRAAREFNTNPLAALKLLGVNEEILYVKAKRSWKGRGI